MHTLNLKYYYWDTYLKSQRQRYLMIKCRWNIFFLKMYISRLFYLRPQPFDCLFRVRIHGHTERALIRWKDRVWKQHAGFETMLQKVVIVLILEPDRVVNGSLFRAAARHLSKEQSRGWAEVCALTIASKFCAKVSGSKSLQQHTHPPSHVYGTGGRGNPRPAR